MPRVDPKRCTDTVGTKRRQINNVPIVSFAGYRVRFGCFFLRETERLLSAIIIIRVDSKTKRDDISMERIIKLRDNVYKI